MANEIKYEDAITRLEEIVSALEKNDVSLDDALKLFEEGTRLTAVCTEKLNFAKAKITEIKKEQA
jgi:exodeoxyribonuclease VII small subunit